MAPMIIKDSTAYWNLSIKEFCALHEVSKTYGVSMSCRPSKSSDEYIVAVISRIGVNETAMIIEASTALNIPFKLNENIFFRENKTQ